MPESSQKVIDYNWPVVMHYAYIQLAKDLSDEEYIETMTAYLNSKQLLVRERKALLQRSKELLEEFS